MLKNIVVALMLGLASCAVTQKPASVLKREMAGTYTNFTIRLSDDFNRTESSHPIEFRMWSDAKKATMSVQVFNDTLRSIITEMLEEPEDKVISNLSSTDYPLIAIKKREMISVLGEPAYVIHFVSSAMGTHVDHYYVHFIYKQRFFQFKFGFSLESFPGFEKYVQDVIATLVYPSKTPTKPRPIDDWDF